MKATGERIAQDIRRERVGHQRAVEPASEWLLADHDRFFSVKGEELR